MLRIEDPTHAAAVEAIRWQAVLNKDAGCDGQFVVAVRTTGVYCRPSCPSRVPRRENVTFFATPDEAERAGFRACKRCSPKSQAHEAEQIERVCRHIQAHAGERLTLASLGAVASLSPQHLQRLFKRVMGISPRQYIEACRLERLKDTLRNGGAVTSAVYEAGFSSSSRVYENAPARLGLTPGAYRNGGSGLTIHYTLTPCPLGALLVAATPRGVCAVSLGDAPDTLEAELRRDFPAAHIQRDDADLGEWVEAILAYLGGQQPHLELPLDVRATAFQQRVWEALRQIPYGQTRSYRQIAAAIGSPQAARAVGGACAHNPVSLVIPCHRAVREDGGLGGYRWGLQRKAALLAHERAHADAD